MNTNGYPSNRANRHKMKDLNIIMKDKDIGVFIETGINENTNVKNISDDHQTNRINKQINKGKE